MIGNLDFFASHRRFLFFSLFFLLPALSHARPLYGINGGYVLTSHTPRPLHGYQLMLNYNPATWSWKRFNIYIDGGFSHFYSSYPHNASINIYSIAPVFRYSPFLFTQINPFIEGSIGLSYLNRTRIEKRNLGIHFGFQDRIGLGVAFGQSKRLTLGLNAVHYSNAHLSAHNSGITIPVVLDLKYEF